LRSGVNAISHKQPRQAGIGRLFFEFYPKLLSRTKTTALHVAVAEKNLKTELIQFILSSELILTPSTIITAKLHFTFWPEE
jgi:hypothetical protein